MGSEAVTQLLGHLEQPDTPYDVRHTGGRVEVVPLGSNTYPVTMTDDGDEATVSAGNWHEHFDDPTQACGCFMGLLTPYYRVVESYRGSAFVCACVQRYEAEGWVQIGAEFRPLISGQLVQRIFGSRERQVILQQAVVTPPFVWADEFPGVDLDENLLPRGSVLG